MKKHTTITAVTAIIIQETRCVHIQALKEVEVKWFYADLDYFTKGHSFTNII